MKRWDVVLIAYPFTDLSGAKVRPALALSPKSHHDKGDDGIFAFITTATDRRSDYELGIEVTDPEFTATGLKVPGTVRLAKILTLDQRLVRKTLGNFGPNLRQKAEQILDRLFFERELEL